MRNLERLIASGVPDAEVVNTVMPSPERLAKGPVAVIECFQEIPCDPCAQACPKGAILPFGDLNDLPKTDYQLCNGCGTCVVRCPGLAIFVVDLSLGNGRAIVKMPYEFSPLPKRGEQVWGLDREGKPVTEATVVRVQRPIAYDRTALLTVEVPASHALEVRGIAVKPAGAGAEASGAEAVSTGSGAKGQAGPSVTCRCEEINEQTVAEAYRAGYTSVDEIKRKLRCGMGPCQGRTCTPLILSMLSRLSGKPVSEIALTTQRPPLKSIALGAFLGLERRAGHEEER